MVPEKSETTPHEAEKYKRLSSKWATTSEGVSADTELGRSWECICEEKVHGIGCRIMTKLRLKSQAEDKKALIPNMSKHCKARKISKKYVDESTAFDENVQEFHSTLTNGGKSHYSTVLRNSQDDTGLFAEEKTNRRNVRHVMDFDSDTKQWEQSNANNNLTLPGRTEKGEEIHSQTYEQIEITNSADTVDVCELLLEKKGKLSAKQYLKKQWRGKRAKRAKKRIRRVFEVTWMSLQSNVKINNMIPNINSMSSAFRASKARR